MYSIVQQSNRILTSTLFSYCRIEFNVIFDLYSSYCDASSRLLMNNGRSNANKADFSVCNDEQYGMTRIVRQSYADPYRSSTLNDVKETWQTTDNIAMQPPGDPSSFRRRLIQGTCTSMKETMETFRNEGRHVSIDAFNTNSEIFNILSPEYTNNQDIPLAIKKA
jgi:hypothetical protein